MSHLLFTQSPVLGSPYRFAKITADYIKIGPLPTLAGSQRDYLSWIASRRRQRINQRLSLSNHSTSTSDPCCCPGPTGSARVNPGRIVTAGRRNPKPTTAPPQVALHIPPIPAAPSELNPEETSSWRRLHHCKSSATFTSLSTG